MASGRPDDSHHSINPYAASAIVDPHEAPTPPLSAIAPRTYRIEMQWADRHRFLRTVGLLRLAAAAGAVMGVYGLYGFMTVAYSAWQTNALATWLEPVSAARWLLTLMKAALGFYACWLQWSLADAIAATAGGTTGRMETWSLIQQRVALLAVAMLAVVALTLACDWLTMRSIVTAFGR
jgi:hypothetical protein